MTKKIFTVSEIIEKIQEEMDLQEETFISQSEFIDYINEGIDDAEAEIMKLYEGYFNTTSTIDLVAGQKAYSLGARDEIQTVTFDLIPNSGTFTLSFDGQTTAAINFNATAADIQSALQLLSNIGTNNVLVTGNFTSGFEVRFVASLSQAGQSELTSASSLLKDATSVVITHATTQEGGALNIYANKLKHVQYKSDSTNYYQIRRLKTKNIAFIEEQLPTNNHNLWYDIQYDSTRKGQQIVFYPTPQLSVTGGVRLWYVRNAERVASLTDLVDMPDAHPYIYSFVKVKVARKELSPLLGAYENEMERSLTKLREAFSTMIPDETEEIERDMSFYNDFDADYWEFY
jgi:hypothetical protein